MELDLRTVVRSTPSVVAELRSMASSRAAQIGERINMGSKPGSSVPLRLVPMTAADTEVDYLHSWAGWAGIDLRGCGRFYRVNGFVRGVIDDDPAPVRELTRRTLEALDAGLPLADGMAAALCELRAVHMRRWVEISDTVWGVALRANA